MADNTETIMSLLSLLGIGGQAQNKSWQSYGGIQKGPVTAIQQARGQISNVASSLLGPFFGPLVGELASDYIVGQDFTRSGALHNNLSGLLAPASGTYANAFQQAYQNQTIRMLTSSRQKLSDDLREDFYRNYYDLTMSAVSDKGEYKTKEARQKAINDQVKQALKNPVSVPAALQFLVDPAQNSRAIKGIKDTQAGMLYWQSRMQPKLSVGLEDYNANRDPVEMAKVLAQGGTINQGGRQIQVTGMKDMIKNANAWILGKGDQSKAPGGYGGFNGASVSELASILQNSANQLDLSGVDQLKRSLKSFEQKVRQTSQALAPLKDIFGEDIKAMTDMIQSVSGQNISQLSPAMIRSIATNTADVSRYSGATVAQIAQAGQKLFLQSAQIGGSTYSRIGAANSGAYYSALIAQGNAPAGVHAAQYAGNTQRAVASAQASAGADRAAMAYGLWKEARAGKNDSVQDFMKEINQARNQGGTLQDAIVSTVNAATSKMPGGRTYNWGSLVQGYSRGGYREFLQSDAGARLGMQGQYQNVLSRTILSLAGAGMEGTSTQRFQKLGQFMLNRKNAALVKDLVTNSNDPVAVQKFRQAVFGGAKGVGEKEIQLFLNNQQGVQEATRYANTVQLQNFQSTQAQLRRELAPLDQLGTGAWLTFYRALSDPNKKLGRDGSLIVTVANGKTATLSGNAVKLHARALLGTSDPQEIKQRMTKLASVFGGTEKAAQLAMLAQGDFAKDQKFIQSFRTVASFNEAQVKGLDEEKQAEAYKKYYAATAYLHASRTKHIGSKTSQKNFQNNTEAANIYNAAVKTYSANMQSAKTKEQEKAAGDKYYKEIQRAYRVRNIQKLDMQSLGLKDLENPGDVKAAFKDLFMRADKSDIVAKLATMDEVQWNKQRVNIKGLQNVTYQQMRSIQRSTAEGYDLKTDVMRKLATLIERALNFLSKKGG